MVYGSSEKPAKTIPCVVLDTIRRPRFGKNDVPPTGETVFLDLGEQTKYNDYRQQKIDRNAARIEAKQERGRKAEALQKEALTCCVDEHNLLALSKRLDKADEYFKFHRLIGPTKLRTNTKCCFQLL